MVHAGHVPDSTTGARAVPIYQTTSYVFDNADQAAQLFELKQYGNIYTRISNPTTAVFEERIASLEGATGALAVASGMAAQFIALMTLLSPGDEVVASSHLYGGTVTQLKQTLQKLSIKVTLVDPRDFKAWEQAITTKTRALYGETIGNPRGSILDLEKLAALANAHKIPLIIDNTFATPYLCRPMEHGATIVLYSATKFIGGHGNAIAGVILDSGNFDFSRFPTIAAPSPVLSRPALLRHLRPLRLPDEGARGNGARRRRVRLADEFVPAHPGARNAFAADGPACRQRAEDRRIPRTERAASPGSPTPVCRAIPTTRWRKKYLPKGPGAVFSFGLKGEGAQVREDGKKFIEALKLFSHLANVGDVRSLVIHPASTTHQQLTDEELVACGVGPEMIRLSVGLENVEDLIWDLDQAFHALSRSTRA